jgi:hypothetical protein
MGIEFHNSGQGHLTYLEILAIHWLKETSDKRRKPAAFDTANQLAKQRQGPL